MLLWFCPNCALYIRYGLRKILGKFGFLGKNGLSRKNFRSWKFPKWPPGVLLGSGLSPKKISAGFTIHCLQTPPDTITFLLVLLLRSKNLLPCPFVSLDFRFQNNSFRLTLKSTTTHPHIAPIFCPWFMMRRIDDNSPGTLTGTYDISWENMMAVAPWTWDNIWRSNNLFTHAPLFQWEGRMFQTNQFLVVSQVKWHDNYDPLTCLIGHSKYWVYIYIWPE